jgi:hypothetical protein
MRVLLLLCLQRRKESLLGAWGKFEDALDAVYDPVETLTEITASICRSDNPRSG